MTEPCFRTPLPVSSIRNFIVDNHWNLVLHLSPEIYWLDRHTCVQFGNEFLKHTQEKLFSKSERSHKGVFILVPECCPRGRWHFHGLALLQSKSRRKKLLRKGDQWLKEECQRYVARGASKAPANARTNTNLMNKVNPVQLSEPTAQIQHANVLNNAIRYVCKNWQLEGKEDLYCISGNSHNTLN